MDKLLLSVTEVKKMTGLARRKITYYMKSGQLPYINISEGKKKARYKILKDTLLEFLTSTQGTSRNH